MARFTELALGDAGQVSGALALGEVLDLQAIDAGTINSNFFLETESGRFCLRVNEEKSEEEVRYECRVLEAFASRGVPTPLPVASPEGNPLVMHAGKCVTVFPWVEGVSFTPRELTPQHCAAAGGLLAQLHAAGSGLGSELQRPDPYSDQEIRSRFSHIAASGDPKLREAKAILGEELCWLQARDVLRASAVPAVIHGDLFPDNVLFHDGRLVAVLDFEQAATGSRAYDLAVALNAWCFGEGLEPLRGQALLEAYENAGGSLPEGGLLRAELRGAAFRFTVTRITDVYLRGLDHPDKDFRRFLMRLAAWRDGGADLILGPA